MNNSISRYFYLESVLTESLCGQNNLNESFLGRRPDDILLEMMDIRLDLVYNSNQVFRPMSETVGPDLFSEYMPLIEATDSLEKVKQDIENLKTKAKPDDSKFLKICAKLKVAWRWWIGADPDRKFNTLRIILKILLMIVSMIASVHIGGVVSSKILATKAVKKIPAGAITLFGKEIVLKDAIISTGMIGIIDAITRFISKNINKAVYKKNAKNIASSIKTMDTILTRIDKLLDKNISISDKEELRTLKSKLQKAESSLIVYRDDYSRDSNYLMD